MRATIKDISKQSGMSKSTVSRVLTNAPHVSPDAVERVNRAIAEIGYVPNKAARSLVSRKYGQIGLVVPEMENPYYTEIIRGIEEVASEKGYGVVLSCGIDSKVSENSISSLLEMGVDGVIHSGMLKDDSMISCMNTWKMPYVLIGRKLENIECNYVIFDDYQSSYRATEYLAELGHRKIAFLFGKASSFSSLQKRNGFFDAARNFGLDLQECPILEGELSFHQAKSQMDKLLDNNTEITAIMASNDMMALGARESVLRSGRRVPDDISIIGIDDIFWSSLTGVDLTTIHMPKYELGKKSCEMLLKKLENPSEKFENCVIEGKLIVRKSCKKI